MHLLPLFTLKKLTPACFDPYGIIIREYTHQVIVYKTTSETVVNRCIFISCTPCSRSML